MNNTEKLVIAFAIFAILVGVFVGIGEYFKTIDMTTVPEFAKQFVTVIQKFFSLGSVTFVVLYLRNILGYARNWIQNHKTEPVNFELNRYYDTIMYYIGPVNIAFAAIPEPYNWVGGVLLMVVEVFTAEFKKVVPKVAS
jgi:hypothetical protein